MMLLLINLLTFAAVCLERGTAADEVVKERAGREVGVER